MAKKPLIIPIFLCFLFIFLTDHTSDARYSQFLHSKPKTRNSPNMLFGYLPKGMPIPPSGPSKRHNDIGLHGSQGLPWRFKHVCMDKRSVSVTSLCVRVYFIGNLMRSGYITKSS